MSVASRMSISTGASPATRQIRDCPFVPDAILFKVDARRLYVKTRTMPGKLSKQMGSTAAELDAITDLTDLGFWIGSNIQVISTADHIIQWLGLRVDDPTKMCMFTYTGNATAGDKTSTSGNSVGGVASTFVPTWALIIPENANHCFMKTAEMAAAESSSLTAAVNDTVLVTFVAGGLTLTTSATLNANGARYHVIMGIDIAGVVDTVSWVGTGASLAVTTPFQPDFLIAKPNAAVSAGIASFSHSDKDGEIGAVYSGSLAANTVTARSATSLTMGTNTSFNNSGSTHYGLIFKATDSYPPAAKLRPLRDGPNRPFRPTSVWNTPIPAGAAVDAHSSDRITNLRALISRMGHGADIGSYAGHVNQGTTGEKGVPILYADNTCRLITLDVTSGAGWSPPDIPLRVPISAKPANGNDMVLCVYNKDTGIWTEIYGVSRSSDTTWTCYTYQQYADDSDGLVTPFASRLDLIRAGGYRLPAGLIRIEEMEIGVIPHALVYAIGPLLSQLDEWNASKDSNGFYPYPVMKGFKRGFDASGLLYAPGGSSAQLDDLPWTSAGDHTPVNLAGALFYNTVLGGKTFGDYGLPYGSRLRLKASLSEAALLAMVSGNPRALVIAKCLRDYGMFLGDGALGFKLYSEDPQHDARYWDGQLSLFDVREVTSAANFTTTNWEVLAMPAAWTAWP